jgi:hypothetical protein
MRTMERTTRAFYGLSAFLLLLGVALRIVPAPAEALAPAARPASPGATPKGTAGQKPGEESAIVNGNVFSPSRSAPRVRYIPPDLVPPAEVRRGKAGPAPTRLRLFGTVVGPSGTAALIDADPAIRGAEIYQVGDTVDGRRIVAVSESTVVLEGAAGRLVLRLQPAGKPTR